jgi:LDH2 family malate/lactate/ureidoglycolate dehydrogenase
MPLILKENLEQFATQLFQARGASEEEAFTVAESLVLSNLKGHDSHGVMRIPFYLQRVKEEIIFAGKSLVVENESSSALACDGGWGFGQVLCQNLCDRLIEKAQETGIACGTIRQAAHSGRLGEYAERAAEQNMVSIVSVNNNGSGQRVSPVGGKRPRLGTNPICLGMPGGESGPFILDIGTSVTAEGKVRVKKIAGEEVPEGWILDSDGNPTTDPDDLYADPPGTILPLGGNQAYKGFGLSFMIEMLCGALSGGLCAFENSPPPTGNSVFMVVISPGKLAGMQHLQEQVSILEEYVRKTPCMDGVEEILLPGDPERNTMKQRIEAGIPIDAGNWSALCELAGELDVPVPEIL